MPFDLKPIEYAKIRGVSRESVRLWIKDGKLDGACQGKGRSLRLDKKKADSLLSQNINEHFQRNTKPLPKKIEAEKQKFIKKAKQLEVDPKELGLDPDEVLSLAEAQALLTTYKAYNEQLKHKEKTGELVSADVVKVQAYNTARQVRDSLLNIPDRIGPILAANSNELEVINLLREEITQALEALTKKEGSE